MASGFFAILDDIAALMDDVALASKIATQKTAGILGDDLAVNAEKATGFMASREIPVLWAITKGSFVNKLIIVPIALLLSYFLPVAVPIVLVLGGFYLAYEAVEKVFHAITTKENEVDEEIDTPAEFEEAEKDKVRAAIATDFILSVEIVIIALGTVVNEPLATKILTVSIVSIIATIGVYGIVALIVRMDDIGYSIIRKSGDKGIGAKMGNFLVSALPIVIRILSYVGTAALILVAGGIFAHQIPYFHHFLENIPTLLKEIILGIGGGIATFIVITIFQKIFMKGKAAH